MEPPESEYICRDPIFECKNVNCKTGRFKSFGWQIYTGVNKPMIYSYFANNYVDYWGYITQGLQVAHKLGYNDLEDVSRQAMAIMNDYLANEHKLFKVYEPVRVRAANADLAISIRDDEIMISFMVTPIGFKEVIFVVGYIHTPLNGRFEIVAQQTHNNCYY